MDAGPAIQSYLTGLQLMNEGERRIRNWYSLTCELRDILKDYEIQPRPFYQIYADIAELFNNEDRFLEPFEEFLRETFPRQHAHLEKCAETRRQLVCGVQKSSLLSLPREIRDKIWEEVVTGNIFHISTVPGTDERVEAQGAVETQESEETKGSEESQETEGTPEPMEFDENNPPSFRRRLVRYQYQACRSHNGNSSSACPAGMGDHIECLDSDPVEHPRCPSINLVCKQILLELPKSNGSFFSENAFQFANLQTAESFLFGLTEPQRSSIQHLKLTVPLDLVYKYEYNYEEPELARSWTAIMNYFSVPWRRRCLAMYPKDGHQSYDEDPVALLKLPVYFYYSDCYYHSNRYRLHERYQVGRGNTSWDIGISGLKYKREPKLELAMEEPTKQNCPKEYLDPNKSLYGPESPLHTNFDAQTDDAQWWVQRLLQFQQYDGLSFQLYNEEGLTSNREFEDFVTGLKEEMEGPEIGPRKCMIFGGYMRNDRNTSYVDIVDR